MINVGDFVRIPIGICSIGEEPNYIVGVVEELTNRDMFVTVELTENYKGATRTNVPKYMAEKISGGEYISATRNEYNPEKRECDHNWIKTGSSPITGEMWFDCESCGKQEER